VLVVGICENCSRAPSPKGGRRPTLDHVHH
jgi:hypothetical protein